MKKRICLKKKYDLKIIKKIFIIILASFMLLIFSGCKNNDNNKKELNEKVISELEYINIKIIDMLNALNNISFNNYKIASEKVKLDNKDQKENSSEESTTKKNQESQESQDGNSEQENKNKKDNNQELINTTEMVENSVLKNNNENINWDSIKSEIELLGESWNVIILDLYGLNVDNSTILEFSSKLNLAMIAIKNEDKNGSLNLLAELYSFIPEFLNQINADINLQRIRTTQSHVIFAYSNVEDITNPEINTNIQRAIDVYSKLISDIDYTEDKTYKTNKVYVLLNELSNSLSNENVEVFYVKYKYLMEAFTEL